jgi:hypothetical protein
MKNIIQSAWLLAIVMSLFLWSQIAVAENGPFDSVGKYQIVAVMNFNPIWNGIERETTRICKNGGWFGGIGIAWTSPSKGGKEGYVERVLTDSPASEAGILAGDYIKALNDEHVRGAPDTVVTLEITRDGKTFHQEVLRSRICLLAGLSPAE